MAASHLLLCFILCTYYTVAHGGDDHGFATVTTSSFKPEAVCSTSRVDLLEPSHAAGSGTLPLVHRYGPCAPSLSSDDKPSFAERLRRSRARANYVKSRVSKGTVSTLADDANVTIPTHLGGSVDSLEYVVTIGLGTPAVSQVLLMDTGSDLSWVQCAPCNATACYPQKDPLFDPRKSSTYRLIPCSSGACRNLTADGYGSGCVAGGSQCGFKIQYGDGSHTRGVYSEETLALEPGLAVKDFRFGCANDQDGQNDKYDGLLGLGGAPESLVSQTSSVYGGAFSYCLPALNSDAGFLSLGGAPPAPSGNTSAFVFVPMKVEVGTFYVVNLTGISVGGEKLDIPPALFSVGTIIDSGTVITELPTRAYTALRTAFRSAMSAYPLLPPSQDLDTCYNFTGFSNVTVPTVALTFDGGATIDLVPNGILLDGCLAFQDGSPGILGNVNQRTFEVLYDVRHGKVGFKAGAC